MTAGETAGGAPPKSPVAGLAGFWGAPWAMPQAVTVTVCVVGIGMILQTWKPRVEARLPGWPWNWVAVFGAAALLAALRRALPRQTVLCGLGSLPMAVASVLALAVVSAPGALWPQGQQSPGWAWRFGFDHVFTSLGFCAAMLLVLANLSLALGRPMPARAPATWRFVAVHGGLLVGIGAACAGSADVARARLTLAEGGEFTALATRGGRPLALPFEVKLHDFRLESFAPTLVHMPGRNRPLHRGSEFVAPGTRERLGDVTVLVERTIARAAVTDGQVAADAREGAGPAAEIAVFDAADGRKLGGGWVHAATPFGGELVVRAGERGVVWMDPPKPRLFESVIGIRTKANGETGPLTLRVNQPLQVGGWCLLQTGYDETLGAASRISVIEAVRDPGYPVVVVGLLALCFGVMWFFWDITDELGRPQVQERGNADDHKGKTEDGGGTTEDRRQKTEGGTREPEEGSHKREGPLWESAR